MIKSIEVLEVRVYAEANEIGHVGHVIYTCPVYGKIQQCCLSLEELFEKCTELNALDEENELFAWNN